MKRSLMYSALMMCSLLFGVVMIPAQDDPTATMGASDVVVTATPAPTEDCEIDFFSEVLEPTSCPSADPIETEAAFQRFEYGFMLWTEADDQIHVMHITQGEAMWLRTPDPYIPGTPERDDAWPEPQPPQTVQPRLGFGELWRGNDALRERIGWAVQEWESVYTARVQTTVDGTIYIVGPDDSLFELLADGTAWHLYR
jgi:hypothetical protein